MPPESPDSGRMGGADAARGTIPSRADGRALRIWTWGIFGLALILRLLALYGLRHAPSYQVLVLDAQGYHERALQLLQGIPAPGLFWQPALYPAFLALVYDLVGVHPLAARVLQALIGSLTACLTLRLGHRVFGLRTGIAAGVVVAAWAPLMLYELDLVADGVSAVWSVALILLFLEVRDRRRGRDALLWGACGALAILTRPTYLPFVACAGAWLAWTGRRSRGRRVPVLLLVGFALVWGPASAFSHRLAGRISPLPFSGGMNLYIGNNPDPCATLNVRPGRGWKRLETEPQRAGRVKPSERNAYFRERVLEYAAADPVSFAQGMVEKAVRFVNSRELPRNEDPYILGSCSAVLRAGMWRLGGWGFPFGVLLPWACAGLWFGRRRIPPVLPLFLVLYAGSVVLVFVSSRYRLAWIPPAAVLAAHGGLAWADLLRRRAWRAAGGTLAGVLVLAAAIAFPVRFCEEDVPYEAEMWSLVGQALSTRNAHQGAETALRRSLALHPDADTHDYLARVLADTGRLDEALAEERRAAALQPGSAEIISNLGLLLGRKGRHAEAADQFRAALWLEPGNLFIRRNLEIAQRAALRSLSVPDSPTPP